MTMECLLPAPWRWRIAAFHDAARTQLREVRHACDSATAQRIKRELIATYPTSPVCIEKMK